MVELITFFTIVLVIGIIIRLIYNYILTLNKTNNKKDYTFKGILNNSLLTDNEKKYFIRLRELLKDTEYIIFSKVRMADIIKTYTYADFNKIRGKHIDFIICDKETKPLLFIELDDKSHNRKNNKNNDIKKDYILNKVGVNIIRTTIYDLENNISFIKEKLNLGN